MRTTGIPTAARTTGTATALAALAVVFASGGAAAQEAARPDTLSADPISAQQGVYNRPFITSAGRTAIGGYMEGNTNYFLEDGVGEGFSMELRRFNIFLYSAISRRLRFISELEFEHGTEEIALETALVDFQVDPSLVFRAGIILPPIGFFNQNHDSPRWEFVERPLVSTEIIPSTLSEVGGGIYGRLFRRGLSVTYDLYLTNGLQDGVILNEEGRTRLASGKSEEQFEEDNNGSAAVSARVAVQHGSFGELGVSYYGAAYNSYRLEGEVVDEERRVNLWALDYGTDVGPASVRGEVAVATIDIPESLDELAADKQWGGHVDVIVPVAHPRILDLANPVVTLNVRIEYVDYNVGSFATSGLDIHDDVTAVVLGVSFRPSSDTVFRFNYRRHWERDFVGNPTALVGGWQFGVATYF